nr:tRNA preQ1(34) S-adenosylmethionine ribosyltransferase-isomerase QueA [Candidatus Omnitrophota bacterium]
MKLSDFDYNLPKELIAQYPAEKRDESRLLVLHKDTGGIEHRIFRDIIEYLNPGDSLVLNNTKVLPAKILGRKETGGKIEVLVLDSARMFDQDVHLNSNEAEEYEALLKPARGCKVGSKIIFGDGELKASVARIEKGRRFLKFDCNGNLEKVLNKLGQMPLPPYIKRQTNDSDVERYQTVYASKNGAVAAPTAGLHFTKKVLEDISEKRVCVEYVTLHVGYGTFKPVSNENITEHEMEKEYCEIENKVIDRLNNRKGRVIAVGTTSARVLETFFSNGKGYACLSPTTGWTELFIYPGYKFNAVDALLTNFHLPKTTLLMLVAAFCGKELLFRTYQEAIREKYRFYSYGDAMLIT